VGAEWIERARRELLSRRGSRTAWGYREGGSPAVEPTALAGLALLATGGDPDSASDRPPAREAASWLARLQLQDGAVPAAPGPSLPGWATPHAMLLWSRLDAFDEHRRHARDWLLSSKGRSTQSSAEDRLTCAHDPSLIGWPWVPGTHSWLEPTAMAIWALCNEGCHNHPRVAAGLRLILDRAIPGGGWNYGNTVVFGHVLRPHPGPTGIALMALAAAGAGDRPAVAPALDYLRRTLPTIRAAASLGWGVLGLKAHGVCPPEADAWLAEAYGHCTGRPDAIVGLGVLLLSAGGTQEARGRHKGDAR